MDFLSGMHPDVIEVVVLTVEFLPAVLAHAELLPRVNGHVPEEVLSATECLTARAARVWLAVAVRYHMPLEAALYSEGFRAFVAEEIEFSFG